MDKLFWLIPGQLAGRPGPDLEPWNLASIRQEGIGAILSVNDGLLCNPEDFAAAGIAYACVPMSPNAPPLPGDLHICRCALPQAYAFVHAQMEKGHGVMVHCTAGKDRTGLFLCYFLVRHAGLSPDEAIRAVREVRPIALSAPGWEELARQLLDSLGCPSGSVLMGGTVDGTQDNSLDPSRQMNRESQQGAAPLPSAPQAGPSEGAR